MLKLGLCDYNDAYILAKGTITVSNTVAVAEAANNANEKVIFKTYAPFTDCISEINNTHIEVVISMYNLIEYSDNYLKRSERLWQYYNRDKPTVNNNGVIVDFREFNVTDSFISEVKVTSRTGGNCTKNVEIMVPLKYLSNFWRTLEIPLINCEINLILTWSANCVIVSRCNICSN